MLAALLITLREGLEAALVVGIVLGVLQKLGRRDRSKAVWAGVVAAIAVSAVAALALSALGLAFEGRGEEIFEGIAMLLAATVLTWMIFWMQNQGRQVQLALEVDTQKAVATDNNRMLFGIAFIAIVREGIETVLFLTASAFSASPAQTLIGGALGLAIAVLLAYLLFSLGKQLNIRAFFRGTGILLIFFAAGLLAHGVHELQEAAILPTIIEHIWDLNGILDENGVVGSLLKALFGYNGNPSLIETIAYFGYFVAIWATGRRRPATATQTEPSRA